MKSKIEINFKFQMELKATVNNEALKKGDKGATIYIKQLVKEFLKDPRARISFYLESFLGLFSNGDLYDIIKHAFKIREDEREHFYPLAYKCNQDVRDFVLDIFNDTRKGKDINVSIPLDLDLKTKIENENRELLYDQFSPLKVTGLRFWEDSPGCIAVDSRLIPTMGWQKWTASTPYKCTGNGKNNEGKKEVFSKNSPPKNEVTISSLQNSIYYFLELVYIIWDKKTRGYRLIVFHHGNLRLDRLYKTERGAKIAFARRYNCKLWKKGLKAEWTHYYPPEETFLK